MRKVGEIDVVDLSGRLSLGNTLMSIEQAILNLIEQGSRRMVINVAGITAMDSAGIGMLDGLQRADGTASGQTAHRRRAGGVARTFGVIHIDRLTPVDADVETSCRAFE